MGKKQHSKDRMYITKTEWQTEWGGYKAKKEIRFRSLPFYCCGISFTPFEDPVCTDDGTVFDIANIVPYVQKFGKHPVSGEPLKLSQLTQLTFHKNSDGEYHCPVMNKVFTQHTHIVAVKTTGNVYCHEAVEELNIKPRNWKDLLTDEKFTRKDLITIQDPLNLTARELDRFDHVKKGLQLVDEEEQVPANNVNSNVSEDVQRALGALGSEDEQQKAGAGGGGKKAQLARVLADAKAQENKGGSAAAAATKTVTNDPRLRAPERNDGDVSFRPGAATWNTDDYREGDPLAPKGKKGKAAALVAAKAGAAAANKDSGPTPAEIYRQTAKMMEGKNTTGAASRGFTSTTWEPSKENKKVMVLVERNPRKKGYVRMHTNLGDLNIELHCDLVPRTCENFLELCEQGYYNSTVFHRSIKSFMIQGGDPTGTGQGGTSIYGDTFRDELDSRLTHSGRGVLSMANSGPSTNGSQFFILYKSAHHLDYKHSVFGKVVGGMEVLSAMEQVPTDDEDRPTQKIIFQSATVFVNPFREMAAEETKQEEDARLKEEAEERGDQEELGTWYSNPSGAAFAGAGSGGVGKYLKLPASRKAPAAGGAEAGPPKKAPKQSAGYGNFDAW
eukprot:CAMPEP_0117695242 /NCGR_PEP_ID=MMETSP0804-20121206/28028_1 /TAXON_ID=1074897 /ORGANISM="Tetraselmis astigmatica, Strain CCMP880" /LENGTH=613 /DNA_ID=CAMNT_0005509287 /DNA_START=160 /DNA_END=2001 /DNA_ORIENTATION=-